MTRQSADFGLRNSRVPARRAWMLYVLLTAGCGSASTPPPRTVPVVPSGPSFEQKMSWILRLEDQRMLRDAAPPPPAAPPVTTPPRRGQPAVAAPPPPPPPPDLVRMLGDDEARIRRRAALAIGRVGLKEGVAPLVAM